MHKQAYIKNFSSFFSLALACKIVNDLINILGDSVMAHEARKRSCT